METVYRVASGERSLPWTHYKAILELDNTKITKERAHLFCHLIIEGKLIRPIKILWKEDNNRGYLGQARYRTRELMIKRQSVATLLHELAHFMVEDTRGKTKYAPHGHYWQEKYIILIKLFQALPKQNNL